MAKLKSLGNRAVSNVDQVLKFMELTLITIRQGEAINKVDQQMVRIISQCVIRAMKKTKEGAVMEGPGAGGWAPDVAIKSVTLCRGDI